MPIILKKRYIYILYYKIPEKNVLKMNIFRAKWWWRIDV